jgi:hypothetical protein
MMKNIIKSEDYNSIVKRITSLKEDNQRVFGTMSSNEMIVHVTDPIREALTVRNTRDLSNFFFRTIGKYFIMYTLPWPKNLPTTPSYLPKKAGTPISNFKDDKDVLLKLLSNFSSIEDNYNLGVHPLLGKLNRKEWGRMLYLHLDHHLKQFSA